MTYQAKQSKHHGARTWSGRATFTCYAFLATNSRLYNAAISAVFVNSTLQVCAVVNIHLPPHPHQLILTDNGDTSLLRPPAYLHIGFPSLPHDMNDKIPKLNPANFHSIHIYNISVEGARALIKSKHRSHSTSLPLIHHDRDSPISLVQLFAQHDPDHTSRRGHSAR